MQITLSPMRRDDMLTVSKAGDILNVNGEDFDFSGVTEGATLPRDAVSCDWLASDVTRIGGELQLSLILPHGPNAPETTKFPSPITVTSDGQVALPPYSIEEAA